MSLGPTLVTGATGFAGGHLLDRLRGRTRLLAWHRPGRPPSGPPEDVVWQPVDVLDRDAVAKAIAAWTPARIYHLAGAPHVDSSWRTVVPHLQANVLGTHHLLDAVRRAGRPCRVLVVTSAQVYRPRVDRPIAEDEPFGPSNPYAFSKLAQDELARRAVTDDRMDVVIARPFNHTGPRQSTAFAVSSFAQQIAAAETGAGPAEVHVGNLDIRRDIVDVRDVVAAYERVMEGAPSGRAFNVASGRGERIGDLLDHLTAHARTPVRVVVDSARFRPSDVPTLVGDASRLRTELSWAPAIPIATTLDDTLSWWRACLGVGAAEKRDGKAG
jgi:GDP-4-dehydro-6-deoxy-D-mannose reductase